MTADTDDIITFRKQRWLDFYDLSRPAQPLYLIRFQTELETRPKPWPGNLPERIGWAWAKYQRQLEQLHWLEDDTLPHLDVYTGTEIFAAAFGCRVHYPPDDMPFALPLIHTPAEVDDLDIPGLDSPVIAPLFEIAEELRRRAGPGAMMRLVDMQSPMDVAALIWEKATFYQALLEAPEAVLSLAHKVKTLQVRFLDEWFARFGREYIAHYPDYYMVGGLTLSEDEVGAVSASLFERLFLPELVDLSDRYGGLGMHCCAHARHQWAGFCKIPNLRFLNFVQPPDVVLEAEAYFASRVPQMHSYPGEGPAWTWAAQHPAGAHLVFEVPVDSREEALETVERIRRAQRN
jgi:Uroporphyrinogen decarboxylase (URO-D)